MTNPKCIMQNERKKRRGRLTSAKHLHSAHRVHRGFSLIELLIVIGILAALLGILLPALGNARRTARHTICASNLRQIGVGLHQYAGDHRGHLMPLAYWQTGPSQPNVVYWWGLDTPAGVDATKGFLAPYLPADLKDGGLLECPARQRDGLVQMQGVSGSWTSSYGYNGYYLSPAYTPGWAASIGHRRWQKLETVPDPARVLALADAMIAWGGTVKNCALLDPPTLFSNGKWKLNSSPTTSFRHARRTIGVFVDGHAAAQRRIDGRMTSPEFQIGSITMQNDPFYVPDWKAW